MSELYRWNGCEKIVRWDLTRHASCTQAYETKCGYRNWFWTSEVAFGKRQYKFCTFINSLIKVKLWSSREPPKVRIPTLTGFFFNLHSCQPLSFSTVTFYICHKIFTVRNSIPLSILSFMVSLYNIFESDCGSPLFIRTLISLF